MSEAPASPLDESISANGDAPVSKKVSLDKIGVSAGTAAVLGLNRIRLLETPTTGYFLFGDKCLNNCAFCAQASGASTGPHHLSRVTWPQYSWEQIEEPLKRAFDGGTLQRACAQTVDCSESPAESLEFVRRVRALSPSVLISVSTSPVSVSRVRSYIEAGASNVGLPVDAATSKVFTHIKGGMDGMFDHSWDVIAKCAALWPGKISTHLIVGLGETEEEAVRFLTKARDAGVTVGLFAFTPVKGTAMEKAAQPDTSSYRRVQLAAYYLRRGGDASRIEFSCGQISGIAAGGKILEEIRRGVPFETSGCPHCNRPYYNERPGQVMMNYPRPLRADEAANAVLESGMRFEDPGRENAREVEK